MIDCRASVSRLDSLLYLIYIQADKPKKSKKKPKIALSFGDEMETAERGAVKLKDMDEITAQRMKEERIKSNNSSKLMSATRVGQAINPLAMGVRYIAPSAKSLQVLDDEDDMMKTAAEAPPVCIARAAGSQSRGPKTEMEDRHTVNW